MTRQPHPLDAGHFKLWQRATGFSEATYADWRSALNEAVRRGLAKMITETGAVISKDTAIVNLDNEDEWNAFVAQFQPELKSMTYAPGTNTGHGHVWERPDGIKWRCGGPGLCNECSRDLADKLKALPSSQELQNLLEEDRQRVDERDETRLPVALNGQQVKALMQLGRQGYGVTVGDVLTYLVKRSLDDLRRSGVLKPEVEKDH